MRMLVATTTVGYKAKSGEATQWLATAEELRDTSAAAGIGVDFFATVQRGHGHDGHLEHLYDRLAVLEGGWWDFTIDARYSSIDSGNRLGQICTGRNLVHEHAVAAGYDAVLFLDSDMIVPPDSPVKLYDLAVSAGDAAGGISRSTPDRRFALPTNVWPWPIVGGNVPSYCLDGPAATVENLGFDFPASWDVRVHWNTAGFLLLSRWLVRALRWRHDPDVGVTDDPAFAHDARHLGYETLVRHDLIGVHRPLLRLEDRGHDLTVTR